MKYIIVVGDLTVGVTEAYGPFDEENAARQWAIGTGGEDRFEHWFSMPLKPTDEDEQD